MYNIVLKEIEKKEEFGFKNQFLYKDLDIFETDKLRIAIAQCKKDKIIYLNTYEPDMGLIQKIREKKSILLVNLLDVINAEGAVRSLLINKLRLFLELCVKYKVPFVFSFLASNEMEMRTLKEGIAIGTLLGLTRQQAKNAFLNIKDLIKK